MTYLLIEKKANLLKAMGQPVRLNILMMLRDGERCVCEIMALIKEDQANISRHLSILKSADIVESRKSGVSVYYKIKNANVLNIIDMADAIVRNAMQEAYKALEEKQEVNNARS